ncbi:metallophosphoesterase [Acidocella sp.]|uniref:metallophosphoesterase n=1 Tax=Acidocella sp. TaxID=50710 RepID=UPI003D0533EF
MTAAPIHFRNERLMLDPSGAAFWPAKRVLIVSDLPASSAPPSLRDASAYNTRAALERLTRLVRLYRPSRLIALGNAFSAGGGPVCLTKDERARLEAVGREAQIIWVAQAQSTVASDLPGLRAEEHREGPFVFRHEAVQRLGAREIEISGHYRPRASIDTRGKHVSRPCFVMDSHRLVLPAFGNPHGGLDVHAPAIAQFFPHGLRVFLLGQEQLYAFALEQLGRLADVA